MKKLVPLPLRFALCAGAADLRQTKPYTGSEAGHQFAVGETSGEMKVRLLNVADIVKQKFRLKHVTFNGKLEL